MTMEFEARGGAHFLAPKDRSAPSALTVFLGVLIHALTAWLLNGRPLRALIPTPSNSLVDSTIRKFLFVPDIVQRLLHLFFRQAGFSHILNVLRGLRRSRGSSPIRG